MFLNILEGDWLGNQENVKGPAYRLDFYVKPDRHVTMAVQAFE